MQVFLGLVLKLWQIQKDKKKYAVAYQHVKAQDGFHFNEVDYFKLLCKGDLFCASSFVVDRDKALAVGGFPEGVTICEDYEFWIRMALEYDVVVTSQILASYHTDASDSAKDYWTSEYKKSFPVLHIHRFLVENIKLYSIAKPSFKKYCVRLFEKCLMQRIYNRRFDMAQQFYDELELKDMSMGWRINALGFVAHLFNKSL